MTISLKDMEIFVASTEPRDIHKCRFCGKQFRNKGGMKTHEKWCNPNNIKWQQSIRNNRSNTYKGKNNPMYGKHHNIETKKKISKKLKGRKSPNGFSGHQHTKETKKKISDTLSRKRKGINNPFYGKTHTKENKKKSAERMKGDKNPLKDPEIKKRHLKAVNTIEFKQKIRERVSGEGNPNWNPNREQVFAPYTEIFYDHNFREKIKKFQYNRDLLTGKLLKKYPQLHHFNKNKKDNSHFVNGDNYCNVGFLNPKNHGKCDKNKRKFKEYKNILKRNTIILKRREMPKGWKVIYS